MLVPSNLRTGAWVGTHWCRHRLEHEQDLHDAARRLPAPPPAPHLASGRPRDSGPQNLQLATLVTHQYSWAPRAAAAAAAVLRPEVAAVDVEEDANIGSLTPMWEEGVLV